MGDAPGMLYGTTDGGREWTREAMSSAGSPGGAIPGEPKTGMAFSGSKDGWMSGAYPSAGGDGFVVRTTDGGRTWTAERSPFSVSSSYALTAVYPFVFSGGAVEMFGVYMGGSSTTEGGSAVELVASRDAGATWSAGQMLAVPGPSRFLVWSFPQADYGIATNGSEVYVTEDGGTSWANFAPRQSLHGVVALDFISTLSGFALVSGVSQRDTILETTDGGHTWTAIG